MRCSCLACLCAALHHVSSLADDVNAVSICKCSKLLSHSTLSFKIAQHSALDAGADWDESEAGFWDRRPVHRGALRLAAKQLAALQKAHQGLMEALQAATTAVGAGLSSRILSAAYSCVLLHNLYKATVAVPCNGFIHTT